MRRDGPGERVREFWNRALTHSEYEEGFGAVPWSGEGDTRRVADATSGKRSTAYQEREKRGVVSKPDWKLEEGEGAIEEFFGQLWLIPSPSSKAGIQEGEERLKV